MELSSLVEQLSRSRYKSKKLLLALLRAPRADDPALLCKLIILIIV